MDQINNLNNIIVGKEAQNEELQQFAETIRKENLQQEGLANEVTRYQEENMVCKDIIEILLELIKIKTLKLNNGGIKLYKNQDINEFEDQLNFELKQNFGFMN